MNSSVESVESLNNSVRWVAIWSNTDIAHVQLYHSFLWNSNNRCALKWNNKHFVSQSLYDKSCDWWRGEMFAFKASAYVNTVDIILFSYEYPHHWNMLIRDTSYMVIYGMSFPVRMFHYKYYTIIILYLLFGVSHYIEWQCH